MIYKASEYGFAVLDKKISQLLLLSPLRVTKDKVKAFYLIHPTKFQKIPEYQDIEEVLVKKSILARLDTKQIEEQLNKIDTNTLKINQILIASGKGPVDGYNEYFEPIVDIEKKTGKLLDDGSIDYKNIESIHEVKKFDKILRKIPSKEPEHGYNIYGEKAEAIIENIEGYKKGKNILQSSDEFIYVSSIDGCLEIYNNEISVSPIVIIKGDVDYDSGNIDFHGSVEIWGSILPGFSVKAKDNIIVQNNIDDASIEAGGDIIVSSGISGKGSTKIISGGKVKAKYIINSIVEAAGDIEVEDSIINSNVYSNNKIAVTDKHGKIIGGESIAFHEIIVNVSGVEKENKTILTVGKNLFAERKLAEIKKDIDSANENLRDIRIEINSSFGEEFLEKPKEIIAILPMVKKKNALKLLSTLSKCNNELKELTNIYNKIKEENRPQQEPIILITNEVYPGTLIKIKNSRKMIDEKLENVKFYEDPEQKIIRFTSAI